MKARKIIRRVVTALLGVAVVGLAGLWIAGPPPLETGVYVQAVTRNSAILAKIDPWARRLTAKVWAASAVSGPRTGDPILVAEDQPVLEHGIRVDGLRAGTKYEFALAADGVDVGGGSFRTAPEDDSAPVRFAAVGDSGQLPWWYNMHRIGWSRLRPVLALTRTTEQWHVAEWISAQEPHFFVHLGDIVYWRQLRDAYEEAFFRPFAGLLRKTPLYTLLGNHDVPRDGGTPPFERLFHNPSPPAIGRPSRNYTVVFGAVRLIALDVLDPGWETGPARGWLERTLRDADEPWLIVATHVPCFSVYAQRTEDAALKVRLWALLSKHGVDLVCSGDDHHFVRFKPTGPGSPTQITVGGGGKSLYDVEPDARVAASAKAWSFLLVEAAGPRLTARTMGAPGVVYDEFVIDRTLGELPANIRPERRRRILGLRK